MSSDIILTGPPRSGTTLACFLLNKVTDTVALHEPMSLQMFPDLFSGLASVKSFFPEMRKSLIENRLALSKVSHGSIPANPFGDAGDKGRASIVKKELIRFDKPLSSDFKLIIKHNGHFTFMLPELQEHYPVFILIRNPLATIASWNSVEAPVAGGNLRVLKTLNPELYELLNDIPDLVTRQVTLLDQMYRRYQTATCATILRYEEMISSNGSSLSVITEAAKALAEPLENKNSNPLYNSNLLYEIKNKLINCKGAYLDYYTSDSIENY